MALSRQEERIKENEAEYVYWCKNINNNLSGYKNYRVSLRFEHYNKKREFEPECYREIQNDFCNKFHMKTIYEISDLKTFHAVFEYLTHLDYFEDRYMRKKNSHCVDVGYLFSGLNSYRKYLEFCSDYDDSSYQEEIQKTADGDIANFNLEFKPKKYRKSSAKGLLNNRPKTNPKIGKKIQQSADYKCCMGSETNSHDTFPTKKNHPYVESHHLIPLKYQNLFENQLDNPGNIVPLCPNCHRKIHNGNKAVVREMLEALYEKQSDKLRLCGTETTLQELLSFYSFKTKHYRTQPAKERF